MISPKIGDIWIVVIPVICYGKNNEIFFQTQKRPVLVIDDGTGLVVENDTKNYHIFKITSQYDSYKRILIKNWKEIGLKKESYVRIEMPQKIEEKQFLYKVTELKFEDLKIYYKELLKIFNIKSIKRILKKTYFVN